MIFVIVRSVTRTISDSYKSRKLSRKCIVITPILFFQLVAEALVEHAHIELVQRKFDIFRDIVVDYDFHGPRNLETVVPAVNQQLHKMFLELAVATAGKIEHADEFSSLSIVDQLAKFMKEQFVLVGHVDNDAFLVMLIGIGLNLVTDPDTVQVRLSADNHGLRVERKKRDNGGELFYIHINLLFDLNIEKYSNAVNKTCLRFYFRTARVFSSSRLYSAAM